MSDRELWSPGGLTERERIVYELAYEAGRTYERTCLAEAMQEAQLAKALTELAQPYEERVRQRVLLFEKCAEDLERRLSWGRHL